MRTESLVSNTKDTAWHRRGAQYRYMSVYLMKRTNALTLVPSAWSPKVLEPFKNNEHFIPPLPPRGGETPWGMSSLAVVMLRMVLSVILVHGTFFRLKLVRKTSCHLRKYVVSLPESSVALMAESGRLLACTLFAVCTRPFQLRGAEYLCWEKAFCVWVG